MHRILTACLLLALCPAAHADMLTDMLQQGINGELQKKLGVDGDSVMIGEVSSEQEHAIGQQVAGRLLGQMPLLDDAGLQHYVNRVGRWVALQSERPDLPWVFGVVDSPTVNAWAIPGGYVFITRALYQQLGSEAELAGVLGHEIGHVQRKHHLKLLKKGQWLQAGTSALGHELKSVDKADAVIGSGAELLARSLDQKAEFEADRIGVVLAARAGYEPIGLAQVLQKLAALADSDSGALQQLFKTHPQPAARLEHLDAAIGDHFVALKGSQTLAKRLYALPTPAAQPKPD